MFNKNTTVQTAQTLLKSCSLLLLAQVKDPNLFNTLLNDQTLSSSELEWSLNNTMPSTNPSTPSKPLPPPDVIQTETTPVYCKADLKVRRHQLYLALQKQND